MVEISVKTNRRCEFIDITEEVEKAVKKLNIGDGICCVFVPHTTAAVTINENADPSVVSDIIREVGKIVPANDSYFHIEGNSDAHIKASLFGASEFVIVNNNRLCLGRWQGLYFCEFDGPRHRKVFVKCI